MTILLDANVLIALAWSHHEHHAIAWRWFHEHRSQGWATSSVTQAAFIRVSSHQRILPYARPVGEVIDALRKMVALPDHHFWIDDLSLANSKFFAGPKIRGAKQVTDAHLVALAIRHSGRVATFDRGMPEVVPEGFARDETVIVIPSARTDQSN